MVYSKIKSIELHNFMSFKKAKISFDETGILNIKGYNDSGKSAILRALAVCLADSYKSKQVKFIRRGEEYFRVVINFSDGVSVLRDKYVNGQSLYEMYKDGECLFTTKQGNKLTRVSEVPKVIADYLGMCNTDNLCLNYQSNEEKLPFVDWSGSENYQAFHEILRMEEIYRAVNMINTDRNALSSEITEIEVALQRDKVLYERCKGVTKELIEELSKLEDGSKLIENRYSKLKSIKEIFNSLNSIKSIPSIDKVNVSRLNKLLEINKLLGNLKNIPTYPSVDKVDYSRLKSVVGISKYVDSLSSYKSIPNIPKIDDSLSSKNKVLISIVADYQRYAQSIKVSKDITEELNTYKGKLKNLIDLAEKRGLSFVKCNNCGTYTVVGGKHGE